MNWHWTGMVWQWARLRISILRFPTLVVVALLFLATGIFLLPPVFQGLLDVNTRYVAMVSWFAFLTAWVGLVTSRLIRMRAGERFGLVAGDPGPEISLRALALWSLAAVPLVVEVVNRPSASSSPRWGDQPIRAALALSGLVLAFLTLYGGCFLQHFMGDPLTPEEEELDAQSMPFLLFSHRHFLLRKARQFKFPRSPWAPARRFKKALGEGYLYSGVGEAAGTLREGHVVAGGFFLLTFLVYLDGFFSLFSRLAWYYFAACELGVLGFALVWWLLARKQAEKWIVLATLSACGSAFVGAMYLLLPGWFPQGTPLPTLASALLIVMLLGWGLAGLGFLFDASRVPVLSGLAVICVMLNWGIGIQHTFPTGPRHRDEVSRMASVDLAIKALPRSGHSANFRSSPPVIIAVATAGGGIQAAAWTAKVLSELSADPEIGDVFGRSLKVISAVSGGSVGTMYFVNAYRDGKPPSTQSEASAVVRQAETSSLEYVGWGLSYPDLWRTLFPPVSRLLDLGKGPTIDRGWALQRAWRLQLLASSTARDTPTMGEWEEDAATGRRPVIILNSTIAEWGRPLLLATSSVSANPPVDTLPDFFEGCDLSVDTAARLSATYPWVSPVARADPRACPDAWAMHLADGGYFDNSGVFSLLAWLEGGALKDYIEAGGTRLVLVEIRSFPGAKPKNEPGLNWIEQTIGPILLLNSVRGGGSDLRDQTAIRIFVRTHPSVETVKFTFPVGSRPPLSWHLTQRNKDDIAAAWLRPSLKNSRDRLKALLLNPY